MVLLLRIKINIYINLTNIKMYLLYNFAISKDFSLLLNSNYD